MILPALVALPAALGLLLRGSWDIWAQTLIHVAAAGGTTLWLLSRTAVGYVPLPSKRNLLWAAALILLVWVFSHLVHDDEPATGAAPEVGTVVPTEPS